MYDASGYSTGMIRVDRRERPVSEDGRNERDADGEKGNHHAGDDRLTRSC